MGSYKMASPVFEERLEEAMAILQKELDDQIKISSNPLTVHNASPIVKAELIAKLTMKVIEGNSFPMESFSSIYSTIEKNGGK